MSGNEGELLAAMVTMEGDDEPELRCRECVDGRVEARYYRTAYTMDLMAGKNCKRCRRTVGAVVMDKVDGHVTVRGEHSEA